MEKFKNALFWFFKSFIWLGLILLIIDIVTKNVIVANKDYILSLPDQRIVLIPNFLGITYLINTNAAFGIGLGNELVNRIVYIILALIVSAIIIYLYVKKFTRLSKMYKACMMLILVGALGNVIDRVFYTTGYLGSENVGVVDWIDFFGIWKFVFNIADSAIVIGVFMLIGVLIYEEIKDRKKNKSQVTLSAEEVHSKVAALEEKAEESKSEDVEEKKEENK